MLSAFLNITSVVIVPLPNSLQSPASSPSVFYPISICLAGGENAHSEHLITQFVVVC